MAKPPNTPRQPTGAESDLWQQVMDGVEPLEETHLLVEQPLPSVEPAPPGKSKKSSPASPSPAAPPVSSPVSPLARPAEPDLSHGEAPGLDRRMQTKMRRGQVSIEAKLDLHGMTQAEAHRELGSFLFDQQSMGRRSVLVVTGKGVGGAGVLRDAVPRWLNEGDNRRMVRAFSHAAPKDGGEGALYVLLKRLK